MEIVLLWLDDLDDLLFSAALIWERLRRVLLQIGLGAAFGLAAAETAAVATQLAPLLSAVATVAVSTWLAGAVARAYYYRETRSAADPA
jgi:hypothetical protein